MDTSPDAAELAVAGFDSHLYYMWPMTRLAVQTSRMTTVHTVRGERVAYVKGAAEVASRWDQLIRFACLRLGKQRAVATAARVFPGLPRVREQALGTGQPDDLEAQPAGRARDEDDSRSGAQVFAKSVEPDSFSRRKNLPRWA